ncbi:ABC transporter permease [Castellaniella sp.]|uniref:ABC transporter permease n=1 Tax=Castellaniella sp. TaxID=1955812 RepID=UPI003C740A55
MTNWFKFRSLQAGAKALCLQMSMFAVTIFGLLLVTFMIGRVVPVDPVLVIVGDRATAEVYARVYAELGLDQPLYHQFLMYLYKVAQGDFGTSVLTSQSVVRDIAAFFPATIELAVTGTLIGVLLGVPLGILSAVRKNTLLDQLVRLVALVGYSIPIFWLGLVGLLVFYVKLDWVAGVGRIDAVYEYIIERETGFVLLDAVWHGQWDIVRNFLSHLVLPGALLGYMSMAYIIRMTRSFMLEQLGQEYIVTARVKGLSEGRIVLHAFRNVLAQLITVIALSFAYLLEGAVLTETVFAWPGLGLYITNSLFAADMNAVLAGTTVIGVCFVLLNAVSDALGMLFDPRTRSART